MKMVIEKQDGPKYFSAPKPNFQILFENLPGIFIVLLPDENFTIAAMSKDSVKTFITHQGTLLGRSIFDVFADNTSETGKRALQHLSASLERALDSKIPDEIKLQCNIEERETNRFHTKYWRLTNIPICDDNGGVIYLINKAEDITGTVASIVDNSEDYQPPNDVGNDQKWLKAAIEGGADAVITVSTDLEPKIVYMNSNAEDLSGWSLDEAKGRPVFEVINLANLNHTTLISKKAAKHIIEQRFNSISAPQVEMSEFAIIFRDTTKRVLAGERPLKLPNEVDSSKRELDQILMQAPISLAILTGPDHVYTQANPSYLRFVDLEVIGKKIAETLSPGEKESFVPHLDQVYATGIPYYRREVPFKLIDGKNRIKLHYLDFMYHPFKEQDSSIKGIIVVVQEVTDQVLARKLTEQANIGIAKERENFRNLFRQTPEMVCVLSGEEHLFEFVNEAHKKVIGFDVTGMTVRKAQPESIEVHGILDQVYRTGVTAELREIAVTVGKKLRYFNLTYAARRGADGAVDGVMILGAEITDQVEARAAIIEAKEAADDANQSKTTFIANMSHEIRTPIGVISGFCELLNEEELPPAERKYYLERVVKNTKSLTRIIDDILDLAKVDAGKIKLEFLEFSLVEVLNEVVDLFSDRVLEKNIYLKLGFVSRMPPNIYSDPTRIRQILINIIGNAIKFTTTGGVNVIVSGELDHTNRMKFEIKVTDTGIGLLEDQIDKIFEPFVQADSSTSRRFGGTGLGLPIARRLAIALGGDIYVDNNHQGRGCSFVITFFAKQRYHQISQLPAAAVSPLQASTLIHQRPLKLSGCKVLIAEDSLDIQRLLVMVLSKNGAKVEIANDGEEAISKALNGNFDIVLMDMQMPRVDGHEATRALRKAGFHRPIIALTAHAMLEERLKTAESGCNAHLTKPINASNLVDTTAMYAKT